MVIVYRFCVLVCVFVMGSFSAYPLCRRSKRLRLNSRVVLFGCDTILEALHPLDTK